MLRVPGTGLVLSTGEAVGYGVGALFVGWWLFGETPARSLTYDAAMRIVDHAHATGAVHVLGHGPGRMLKISPRVNGAKLGYRTNFGEGPSASRDEVIDPRLLVLLLRMTEQFPDIVSIDHAGIYPSGHTAAADETHNRGTSIDFSRFVMSNGTTYDVLRDWGSKPKSGPGMRLPIGSANRVFFDRMYEFLAGQATDMPTDGCGFSGSNHFATSTIGDKSFLITPDHGSGSLAAMHRDHIHAQVGPTRNCAGKNAAVW